MSKRKKICSIYHFENYFQSQKLNSILKILFSNDELTPRAEKIKTLHTSEIKWGIGICCQARILTLCSNIEKVRESMFKIPCSVFKSMFKIF